MRYNYNRFDLNTVQVGDIRHAITVIVVTDFRNAFLKHNINANYNKSAFKRNTSWTFRTKRTSKKTMLTRPETPRFDNKLDHVELESTK